MAQQTAVMELLNFILVERRSEEDGSIKFHAHEDFERFLKMEKEQIKMAYNDGADHMVESKYEGMDNYYKLRYGSNNQI